jgi:hypothetical protein
MYEVQALKVCIGYNALQKAKKKIQLALVAIHNAWPK